MKEIGNQKIKGTNMPAELQQCPERDQLVEYLLGKLPNEDSTICEAHIADCDPCEQTIRSLDVSDTLSELALNGLRNSDMPGDEESAVIKQLVHEIEGWTKPNSTSKSQSFEARVSDLDDRAAEVQHFFDKSDDPNSIGNVGKYRIVELLGAGSSGVVYRATDSQLGRDVAVKFLRPSLGVAARQRFLTEAQAAAVINHPNVVQIYEVGMEDKLAFIAMQCLPGQTLEQLLAEHGALTGEETRRIGKQITAGMAAAHRSGIIHRDIKPANIWICSQTENVTILDFGLARILDEDPQLTCTGLIAGTPCFMSPEQTRGRNIDRRSDFFSLGCLLYQCLTGVLPFKSENVLATLQSVQMLTPTAPHELDPAIDTDLSSLVMTLLEKSPVNRPDQANDIADAFDLPCSNWNFKAAENRQAVTTGGISKPKPADSQTNWWPTIVSLIGLGFLFLGAFFTPQIIRIATNQGQIVIESNDPDVQVEVLKGGERIEIVDLKTKQKLNIVAGEYQLRPIGDENEISIDKETVTIKRGKDAIVRVTRARAGTGFKDQSDMRLNAKVYEPFQLVAEPNSDGRHVGAGDASAVKNQKSNFYLLDTGDILGVFVEGVLGNVDEAPPINIPPVGSNIPPSVGFPIAVMEDGTISIPHIPDVMVRGKSIKEVKQELERTFKTGDKPILTEAGRIMVSLARRRGYKPPAVVKQGTSQAVPGQVAMAAAHLAAAESEHGKEHPFTQQLKKNLEILLGNDTAAKARGAGQSMKGQAAQLDTPTFNGETYAECYRIAKFERNPKLAWPAVRGLIELHDEENKEDTIQTCLEFFRRTKIEYYRAGEPRVSEVLGRFGVILDAKSIEAMLVSEIKTGTRFSQEIMVDLLASYMDDERKRKAVFEDRKKEIAETIVNSSNNKKLRPLHAIILLQLINSHTDLDMAKVDGINQTLVEAFSDSENGGCLEFYLTEFAMDTMSDSPEIIETVFTAVSRSRQQDSTSESVYERLYSLSPKQLKVCVPLIQENKKYLVFKNQEVTKSNSVSVPSTIGKLFRLIACIGDHAQVPTLKDDFEKFEGWRISESSYLKARDVVLGKKE